MALMSMASIRPASFSTGAIEGFEECREAVVLGNIQVVHHLLQTLHVAQHVKCLGCQRDIIWWWGLGREANDDALQRVSDKCLAGVDGPTAAQK